MGVENDDYMTANDQNDCKYGGGIYIPRTTNYEFYNCCFINNAALTGSAIFSMSNSIVSIEDSVFINNDAMNGNCHTGMGGGIYVTYNVELTTNRCKFDGNYATSMGGAIMIDYGSQLTVDEI